MLATQGFRGSSQLARPVGVRLFSAAGAKRSWVEHDASSEFPLQNLPFGVFSCSRRGPRCATAIGDKAVDLAALADAGLLADLPFDAGSTFRQPTLNKFMSMSRPAWRATRARLQELLATDGDDTLRRNAELVAAALQPLAEVKMHLPAQITDYTDFYASREHATNVGIMFRGRDNALQPNWLHLPVGYHGRASSVVVSGTPVARPRGQLQINREDPKEGSQYGPCKLLDYELEMGVFVGGKLPPLGRPVTIEEAEEHIFGYVILNDWSARDVQAWEYVPLGPFTAKNFASTISPWIVTPDALAPFRCPTSAKVQKDPEVLPYLRDPDYSSYDLQLEIDMLTPSKDGGKATTTTIAKSNFSNMYWTARQMLAHHSVTGCPFTPGDLLGSGTISGTIDNSKGESINYGSLLEQTWRGAQEIKLSDGNTRKFIQDGDSILMRGYCQGDGFRVGFGACEGEILPAGALDAAVAPTSQAAAVGSSFSDVTLSSYWRSSCSWRVRVALAHYGVAYKYEPVHLVKGEQGASEHLMGQVPSFSFTDADGKHHTLTQSVAIIDFLDAAFGSADGPAPLVPPADGTAVGAILRSRALEIAEVIGSGTQPLQNLSVLKEVRVALNAAGEEVEAKPWAKGKIERGLVAIEKLVAAAGGRYAAGHMVTIADAFLIPQLYNARRFGVDLAAFPNLLRVEAALTELPAFKAAAPEAQPDFDPNAAA